MMFSLILGEHSSTVPHDSTDLGEARSAQQCPNKRAMNKRGQPPRLPSLLSSAKDQVSCVVSILSLRQQAEARLDEMDAYTCTNLLKLCHVFILRRPAELVLVELGSMCISDCEKYIMLDTQNSMLFWQSSESHHLRKLNVRAHSPLSRTLTYGCPPRALPRAPVDLSGFVALCNDNSNI